MKKSRRARVAASRYQATSNPTDGGCSSGTTTLLISLRIKRGVSEGSSVSQILYLVKYNKDTSVKAITATRWISENHGSRRCALYWSLSPSFLRYGILVPWKPSIFHFLQHFIHKSGSSEAWKAKSTSAIFRRLYFVDLFLRGKMKNSLCSNFPVANFSGKWSSFLQLTATRSGPNSWAETCGEDCNRVAGDWNP